MAHVTNSSINVRGYYYSSVNTGKARSDIIEGSLNCSWISAKASKHFIRLLWCQLKAGSTAVFIKNKPKHSLPSSIPIHSIVVKLENSPLDQGNANVQYWVCMLSVLTVQVVGSQDFLWVEVCRESVPACSVVILSFLHNLLPQA